MLNEEVAQLLFLYKNHVVNVVTDDGEIYEGVLTSIETDKIVIDDRDFLKTELSDVRYCGFVTDYHTYKSTGEINSVYTFELSDCIDEEKIERLKYHEFECKVSCHLVVENNAIKAQNVKLEETIHVLNENILAKDNFLYFFWDNSCRVGTLIKKDNGYALSYNGSEVCELVQKDISDITRLPAINDNIIVYTKDGQCYSGLVCAVQEDSFNLYEQMCSKTINYTEIKQIRYYGKITENRGMIDGVYRCKLPFYLKRNEDSGLFLVGRKVSYVVGINKNYQIAREVEVESGELAMEQSRTYLGVVLTIDMNKPDGIGYIGNKYVTKACGTAVRGGVSFSREQVPFTFDFDYIHVVKYTLEEEDNSGPSKVAQMELVEKYEWKKYGIVEIDEEGNVHAIPLFRACISFYEKRDVDVVCKDGILHSGVLVGYNENEIRIDKGNSDAVVEPIAYEEIDSIRIVGSITEYNSTKGIGWIDQVFFHINNVQNSEAQNIRTGVQVSFVLQNSGGGKNNTSGKNYNRMDYLEGSDVRIVECERIIVYVTAYADGEFTVMDEADYENNNRSAAYQIRANMIHGIQDLNKYDYRVMFCMQRSDGRHELRLDSVLDEPLPKRYYGYIDNFYNDKKFGFITPEESYGQLSTKARMDSDVDVYCRATSLKNPPDNIDTIKNVYFVAYTLDYNAVNAPKEPALSVWFLSSKSKVVEVEMQEPQIKQQSYKLKDAYGHGKNAEKKYSYGILSIYKSDAEYIKINKWHQNANMYGEDEKKAPELVAYARMGQFAFVFNDNINTSKNVYVVRFVVSDKTDTFEGGVEGTVIDYNYPVEIVDCYSRKQIKSIIIDAETITFEVVERKTPTVINQDMAIVLDVITEKAPDFMVGETLFYKADEISYSVSAFKEYSAEGICLENGVVLEPEKTVIWRFGVMTGVDEFFQHGYLNGRLQFDVTTMESKTYNIAKNAMKRMLLSYTCKDGSVVSVERVPRDVMKLLPWERGMVTACTECEIERTVTLDGKSVHYLSVMSDGLINRLVDNNQLLGQSVYMRQISCPDWEKTDSGELIVVTADLHCTQEQAIIRYDEVRDGYRAYRNHTHSVPVEGPDGALADLVEEETTVFFKISDKPSVLVAYIDAYEEINEWENSDAQDESTVEVSNTTVLDSCLAWLRLSQVDLQLRVLPRNIVLGADGWPKSGEQEKLLIQHLCTKGAAASDLIAAVAIGKRMPKDVFKEVMKETVYDHRKNVEELLRLAFRQRVLENAWDNNIILGEYTYYVQTLLQADGSRKREQDLYLLFLQDFYSPSEMGEKVRTFYNTGRLSRIGEQDVKELFRRECSRERARELLAHIVALDAASVDHLLERSILQENGQLVQYVLRYGNEYDPTYSYENINDLLAYLRKSYQQDKVRYSEQLSQIKVDFSQNIKGILEKIDRRLIKLFCQNDVERFQLLASCCNDLERNKHQGFSGREKALREAYRRIDELQSMSKEHPTKEVTELLLRNNILQKLQEEIVQELDALYKNPAYYPDVLCRPNEYAVTRNQKDFVLLIENGIDNSDDMQVACDLTLSLESIELGNDGIESEIRLSPRDVFPGADGQRSIRVKINLDGLEGDNFSIDWSVRYTYIVGFKNGEAITAECCRESSKPIEMQISHKETYVKNAYAVNPYKEPAKCMALQTSKMFYGRKQEFRDIWDVIVDQEEQLRAKQTVIIYGQKKCGKTSLIYQIRNAIQENINIREQALLVNFDNVLNECGGVGELDKFFPTLCKSIIGKLSDEIYYNHRELYEEMEKNNLHLPTPEEINAVPKNDIKSLEEQAKQLLEEQNQEKLVELMRKLSEESKYDIAFFKDFFQRFQRLDQGRHKVVLIMDEFTFLCTTAEKRGKSDSIKFVKTLSELGFIQIIIGHAAMMEVLGRLGLINQTSETAEPICISAFEEAEAKQLVCEPMIEAFGYNPYATTMGEKAVEKLLELSGRSPSILMKLCNQMFEFYRKKDGTQIYDNDVDDMVRYCFRQEIFDESSFDMLLTEDGDEIANLRERPSYRYLKCVAEKSLNTNNRDCDMDVVCEELGEVLSKQMRDTLKARQVLTVEKGRIKINAALFAEYIYYEHGLK